MEYLCPYAIEMCEEKKCEHNYNWNGVIDEMWICECMCSCDEEQVAECGMAI